MLRKPLSIGKASMHNMPSDERSSHSPLPHLIHNASFLGVSIMDTATAFLFLHICHAKIETLSIFRHMIGGGKIYFIPARLKSDIGFEPYAISFS